MGRSAFALLTVGIAALALGAGCGAEHDVSGRTGQPMHARDKPVAAPQAERTVARVLSAQRAELFHKWPGVVGFGIGTTKHSRRVTPKQKAFIIVVFLKNPSDMPAKRVALDGVPIRFKVTGVVQAQ